jgi:hypothetical protein
VVSARPGMVARPAGLVTATQSGSLKRRSSTVFGERDYVNVRRT